LQVDVLTDGAEVVAPVKPTGGLNAAKYTHGDGGLG
jgi:hypothetical protein